MAQIHLHAEPGDYAPVVLLPGDPNRAKRIAARFDGGPDRARLVNEHRGLLGYTGTVDGVPVSVQTTGMGTPTTSIVVEELLNLGVETFIRVGTCGGFLHLDTGDVLVASAAVASSGIGPILGFNEPTAPTADHDVTNALVAAAKRDVDVRVVYDDIGSGADAAFFKPLINAGGKAREFNSVRITTNLGLANFRTHRKIVVCDGVVGFCGGNNLHDPISAEVTGKSAWRDLHVRIRGDAVHQLQRVFLENWMYTRGRFSPDAEERPRYFPPQTSTGPAAQVLASGPDGDEAAIYRFVLGAMATARQRVWIQTPYLIPDEPFESALQVAVLRGVDVRILVPLEGDSKLVGAASRTWCESLVRTGVTIHEYTPRMLHAKALLVDEVVGVVGTANMDNRSFRLNFEVMVAIYDAAFVRQLAARMETDAAESRPFRGRGRGHRLTAAFESLARLASPIL